MSDDTVLEVRDLGVRFPGREGPVTAVHGVSFHLPRGRTLGVVGESGCGKSACALAILGLHAPGVEVTGTVTLDGEEVPVRDARRMRAIRGDRIAMVFQDPMTALHPMLRVGDQVAEGIRAHRRVSRRDAAARAVRALGAVDIPSPERRARQYPHELSGGMRQRVMIAMALALEPRVLVADEPTTALDATVQAQVLGLIDDLRERTGMGVLLISHSLATVADVAHEVAVMYAGRVVEGGPAAAVLGDPRHPYTRGLLASVPRLDAPVARLTPIPGSPPSPLDPPSGCAFHPRCDRRIAECAATRPALEAVAEGRRVACHQAGTPARPVAQGATA